MKILHTSDWHLGHTLYGYDRHEEQAAMLRQMVEIVTAERPDLFLLCGDVYHTPQPSAAVQTMLSDTLLAIHRSSPQTVIVVTAGNHDSASRHEVFRAPWRELNVYAIGQIDRDRPETHVIDVAGKGWCVAVPFFAERNLPEGFFRRMADIVAERNSGGLPVVMSAHTTLRGSDITGHDHATDSVVGGIEAIGLEQLGDGYDYLALGHIHREQFVHTGRHKERYSGTPLPVSFDETFTHSVSLVEIDRHGDRPRVERRPVDNPRPLVTLPTDGFATWTEARQLLENFPGDIPAYIRLNVAVDDFLPLEAQAEAARIADGKQCRFCCINARRRALDRAEAKTLSVEEFQTEEPIDIARRYAQDMGIDFDEQMQEMFSTAERSVKH